MSDLFLISAKAYQLKDNLVFLKTDVGHLVYDSSIKELGCVDETIFEYCQKYDLKVQEIQIVFLEEVIHENAKISLTPSFKNKLNSHYQNLNQQNKAMNSEMYSTLFCGMVIAIIGAFLL